MSASTSAIDTVARTIWGEARNQGRIGMQAVASTIANRVNLDLHGDGRPDWWGEGFVGVCRKPWQYSCWNENDPNRARLLAVTAEDPQFAIALDVARAAVDGSLADRTNGATHYFAPHVVAPPAWAKSRMPTASIGDHVFYRVLD